jgi:hypothetical protein
MVAAMMIVIVGGMRLGVAGHARVKPIKICGETSDLAPRALPIMPECEETCQG